MKPPKRILKLEFNSEKLKSEFDKPRSEHRTHCFGVLYAYTWFRAQEALLAMVIDPDFEQMAISLVNNRIEIRYIQYLDHD